MSQNPWRTGVRSAGANCNTIWCLFGVLWLNFLKNLIFYSSEISLGTLGKCRTFHATLETLEKCQNFHDFHFPPPPGTSLTQGHVRPGVLFKNSDVTSA